MNGGEQNLSFWFFRESDMDHDMIIEALKENYFSESTKGFTQTYWKKIR